ncbi:MAG: hypothetical protein DMF17_10630, partial [Verrucomicrobia bacterium]
GQALRRGAFFFGNTDARGNLELLDVNSIGEKIWLIGHGVDQSRRGTGQGKTDLAGGAPA